MEFFVNPSREDPKHPDSLILRPRDWNDWFKFRTLFWLEYVDQSGDVTRIGTVKIGQLGHNYVNERGQETPLDEKFSKLPVDYVSLGTDETYYEKLRYTLGAERSIEVLKALRDIALNKPRFQEVQAERVVTESLLRGIAPATVRNKFHRIAKTGDRLAAYKFSYQRPSESPQPGLPTTEIHFDVRPESRPPTNVHVLIGRNGSGKTTLLRSMARAMLGPTVASPSDGTFDTGDGSTLDLANLVYVAFSAFDEAKLPVLDKQLQYLVPYTYVGLQSIKRYEPDPPGPEQPELLDAEKYTRAPLDLESDFAQSALHILKKKRGKSWSSALQTLESDPNFDESEVATLSSVAQKDIVEAARAKWKNLSTGHRIVLLTITRLVETVTERTLVLMDEPEGHLHPPLLSAFIRALSSLLSEQNGVAIVATHSPVILQEVPATCVSKIRRVGFAQAAERPKVETFGESVGMLTSDVFSLEVTDSGFNKVLSQAALELGSYEAVIEAFNGELGFEARALLRAMFSQQDA